MLATTATSSTAVADRHTQSACREFIYLHQGGGGTEPPAWIIKSATWYINDPYKMQDLVYEWVSL